LAAEEARRHSLNMQEKLRQQKLLAEAELKRERKHIAEYKRKTDQARINAEKEEA